MRLATRMKLTYSIVFMVPLTVIILIVVGFTNLELRNMKVQYDMEETSIGMIYNPYVVMEHMNVSAAEELHHAAESDVAKLTDEQWLTQMNQKLAGYESCLVVKVGEDIIFNGFDGTEASVPLKVTTLMEGAYLTGGMPYYVRQINFKVQDGRNGIIQIYTYTENIIHSFMIRASRMAGSVIFILLLASALSFLWLYQSIVQPLEKLKTAAVNIRNGNLDFNVVQDTDDEIGEVCTAFEEMRIKLKEQIDVSMQYEKDSRELISNISHDLKTPITAIKGYVEGIRDGVADTPEKMKKYLRTIYNKASDMDALIDELFLYSKLDSNSMNYSFEKISVMEYFNDCMEEISLDLESRGINYSYINEVDEDTLIIADPEQLKRVINNIVGNSIKYMSDDRLGQIDFKIMDEPEYIQVSIKDNGKGIARKELPRIFERTYRTDASRNSKKGGSGLGLSIAKKIIEEHGGKIFANSVEGEGTTMSFVLRKHKESVRYE